MKKNTNLNKAKKAANNEFYTQLSDIENELQHYKDHFKDKIVYCNCDTQESNFYKYFKNNFETLGLKGLLRSSLADGVPFQSEEGIELLKQADIVVTNPPFSLLSSSYINLLELHKKDYLLVIPIHLSTSNNIFKLIKSGRLEYGLNRLKTFITSTGDLIGMGNTTWITTMKPSTKRKPLIVTAEYDKTKHEFIDNYHLPVINVNRIKDIPKDYYGLIAVPITIFGYDNSNYTIIDKITPKINGKSFFQRIIIKIN